LPVSHLLSGLKKAYFDATEYTDRKSQAEPNGHEIHSILPSLSNSIDWLHRFANMVRQAGTLRQNAKVAAFILKDEQGGDATPVHCQLKRRG
jgi:hypothetical protein